MISFITFQLIVVLYGQLIFNALSYFGHILNPSWPFWGLLYSGCFFVAINNIKKINLYLFDLIFLIFTSYLCLSFVLTGESPANEFYSRLLMFIIGPYICGRILGEFGNPTLKWPLFIIFLIYVALIGTELIKNPALFTEEDRLRLFPLEGGTSDKGISTAYNIGLNFGSIWICFFSYILWSIKKNVFLFKSYFFYIIALLIIPLLNLAVGSRSSMISIAIAAFILMLYSHINLKNLIKFAVLSFVVLGFSYMIMPESRLSLLNQTEFFADIISSKTDSENCVLLGSSITARGTLAKEAFKLFNTEPLNGIGAGNYGWKYCGNKEAFGSPHSLFLQSLVDLGVLGTSILIMLLIVVLSEFNKTMNVLNDQKQINMFMLFALWIFMIIQMQLSGNMYYDYQLFLLTGLIAGAAKKRIS